MKNTSFNTQLKKKKTEKRAWAAFVENCHTFLGNKNDKTIRKLSQKSYQILKLRNIISPFFGFDIIEMNLIQSLYMNGNMNWYLQTQKLFIRYYTSMLMNIYQVRPRSLHRLELLYIVSNYRLYYTWNIAFSHIRIISHGKLERIKGFSCNSILQIRLQQSY